MTLRFRDDNFSFYVKPKEKIKEKELLPDCTDGQEVEDKPVDEV